jgi:hypothetical protein
MRSQEGSQTRDGFATPGDPDGNGEWDRETRQILANQFLALAACRFRI